MRGKPGSISIFLAIIYLSLIVFSCSIIELTRYEIGRVQAERALFSASQSILGGYDLALKERYGIFARDSQYGDVEYIENFGITSEGDMLSRDLYYYTSNYLSNNPNDLRESLIDTFVIKKDDFHSTFMDLKVEKIETEYPNKLINLQTHDLEYVKEDMLKYMDYRGPLLALEPFIEKLNIMEKMGKTSKFIKGKNEQVNKASELNDAYTRLYTLVDGIVVNDRAKSIFIQNDTYIKGVVTKSGERTYENKEYIPNSLIQSKLYEKQIDIRENINTYDSNNVLIENILKSLKNSYEEYEKVEIQLISKKKDLLEERGKLYIIESENILGDVYIGDENKVEKNESEILSLKKSIDNISRKIEELSKEKSDVKNVIGDLIIQLDKYHEDNITILDQLKRLTISEDGAEIIDVKVADNRYMHYTMGMNLASGISSAEGVLVDNPEGQLNTVKEIKIHSYLEINKATLAIIQNINKESIELNMSINEFVDIHEPNKNDYVEDSYVQSIKDLENIKESFALESDSGSFIEEDNLTIMQDIISKNINVLESVSYFIDKIDVEYQLQLNIMMDKIGVDKEIVEDIINDEEMSSSYIKYVKEYSPNIEDTNEKNIFNNIREILEGYSTELYFDYSGYTLINEESSATKFYDGIKMLISDFDISKIYNRNIVKEVPIPVTSPSKILGYVANNESSKGYFEEVSIMGNVGGNLDQAREQILLNEYAVGMFSAYSDRMDLDKLTLAGYKKSEHVMNTELEYILTGIENPQLALDTVIKKILAIRVVSNSIHLMSNSMKREMIIRWATTLAGWIPAGLGVVLLTMLITVAWATAEGMIDITLLTLGKKLPLIKTTASWYLGVGGAGADLLSVGLELLEYVGKDVIEQVEVKMKTFVDTSEEIINKETKMIVEATLTSIYEEGRESVARAVQTAENKLYSEIDNFLKAYKNNQKYLLPNELDNTLTGNMLKIVLERLKNELGQEAEYKDIVKARKKILDELGVEIENMKKDLEVHLTKEVDNKVDSYMNTIKVKISEVSTSAQEVLAMNIKKESDIFLKELNRKKVKNPTIKNDELQLSDFIPSFTYQDYIRMFMLLEHKDVDGRVARMLDMIELNMSKNKEDENHKYQLSNYITNIEATGEFTMRGYLFLMPFLKYRNTKKEYIYHYNIKVANGYE